MPSVDGVPVELDRERTLRYERRSIYTLEDRTGHTLPELLNDVANRASYKSLALLVWCGLIHESPDLDVMEVVDMLPVGADHMERITTAIGEALSPLVEAQKNGKKKK